MRDSETERFPSLEEPDKIIDLIQEQQKQCTDFVTELTREQIEALLKAGNYFFAKKGETILASAYQLPLIDSVDKSEQIYRLGGLSVLGFRDSSIKAKKEALLLLRKIEEYVENKNSQLIMKTENPVLARVLETMGAEKLSYDECLQKYPSFLKAYINKSKKTEEYYKTQTFYVRPKK
jgi:hypothetical protein